MIKPQIQARMLVHSEGCPTIFGCTRAEAYGRVGPGAIELAREHWWRSVGMSGFARRTVSTVRSSSEHRSIREPKAVVCTLGTLNIDCWTAFSLLCFFVAEGPRNEVPPRTVANSDKKFSQHTARANVRSNNPALIPDHRPSASRPAPRVRTLLPAVHRRERISPGREQKPIRTYPQPPDAGPVPLPSQPSTE